MLRVGYYDELMELHNVYLCLSLLTGLSDVAHCLGRLRLVQMSL